MSEQFDEETMANLLKGLRLYNEQNPAAYNPPPFVGNYRHLCLKARQAKATNKGVSTAIDLHERYVTDWNVDDAGKVTPVFEGEGEVALIYREGKCTSCKEVARSKSGRIVRTNERPPVSGRVGRD